MSGLYLGSCIPNLKLTTLVILELLAFNAQNQSMQICQSYIRNTVGVLFSTPGIHAYVVQKFCITVPMPTRNSCENRPASKELHSDDVGLSACCLDSLDVFFVDRRRAALQQERPDRGRRTRTEQLRQPPNLRLNLTKRIISYHIISYRIVDLKRQTHLKVESWNTQAHKLKVKM